MSLWRENMQIPQDERNRKKVERKKDIIRNNSFYIAKSGKSADDYIETPENRRAAGISIENT